MVEENLMLNINFTGNYDSKVKKKVSYDDRVSLCKFCLLLQWLMSLVGLAITTYIKLEFD